jgi:nitrate/nitrite transporter NarK
MLVAGPQWARRSPAPLTLALGMGFANAAVFKLVPKYSPGGGGRRGRYRRRPGRLRRFAIPLLMGLFVKISPTAGYAQGFSVFLVMSIVAVALVMVLKRNAQEH